MADLILHHYQGSLFSEKIRANLGFKNRSWKSVEISPIMPRPDLMPLTGGYRRTPVLQVGADIFCDTHVITELLDGTLGAGSLAELGQPEPSLVPAGSEWAARTLTQRADSHLFQVVVALCFQPEAVAPMLEALGAEMAARFAEDRAQLTAGGPPVATMPPKVAAIWLHDELGRLEQQLEENDWLLGTVPCIADFAVYHCLWLLRNNPVVAPLVAPYPGVLAWMTRIREFGHGDPEPMTSERALAIGRESEPMQLEPDPAPALPKDVELGEPVAVRATDYGVQPVTGILDRCTPHFAAVLRDDEAAGRVRVHFPRAGFRIDPAE